MEKGKSGRVSRYFCIGRGLEKKGNRVVHHGDEGKGEEAQIQERKDVLFPT